MHSRAISSLSLFLSLSCAQREALPAKYHMTLQSFKCNIPVFPMGHIVGIVGALHTTNGKRDGR